MKAAIINSSKRYANRPALGIVFIIKAKLSRKITSRKFSL